jgi:hypothetical protein
MKTLLISAIFMLLAGCVRKDTPTPSGPQGSGIIRLKINGQTWAETIGPSGSGGSSWDPSIGYMSFERAYKRPGFPGVAYIKIQCNGGVNVPGEYKLGHSNYYLPYSQQPPSPWTDKYGDMFYSAGSASDCYSTTDSLQNTGNLKIDFMGWVGQKRVMTGTFNFVMNGPCGRFEVTEGEFDMFF